jgi:hypothetical protein
MLRAPYATALLFFSGNSALRESGFLRSFFHGMPVDRNGNPLPWMNYPAIMFLNERLKPQMRVFEYGSGSSTRFLSDRVASVCSVEHDKYWFERVRKTVTADNVTLLHRNLEGDGAYCRAIRDGGGVFDLVIVDGRDRVNCVRQALGYLSPGGVLLLDNSERPRYRPAHDLMNGAGFKSLNFTGLLPLDSCNSHGTLFYKDANVFEL